MSINNQFTRNPQHRGITLLVVLALMVMFAMLVTAFMVIVTQSRRTAETVAKHRIEPPIRSESSHGSSADVDTAFLLLLIGSRELNNVIAPHSILENLYGHPDRVPTRETRFGGTGAGYIPDSKSDARLAIKDSEKHGDVAGKPFALRPNILAPNADGTQKYKAYLDNHQTYLENYLDDSEHITKFETYRNNNTENHGVWMNPNYTAPDIMTMFLAWNDIKSDRLENVIPSFHRPQLVEYWKGTTPDENELRKYVLRPLPTDHPNFSGSNPAASTSNFLTKGPWDVDNDGNGIADGIWLDMGLPARYDKNTDSWYKPLFSCYVIDMDGRINVNTMNNLTQAKTLSPPAGDIAENTDLRGLGLGVAELSSELLPKTELNVGSLVTYPWDGSVPPDWFGLSPIMFDSLGNRILSVPIPRPDNPYMKNPYSDGFSTDDLESILRSVIDLDYSSLPPDLLTFLGSVFDPVKFAESKWRYNLATRSSDIPISAPLYNRVLALCNNDSAEADQLWTLLPEEIREGKKVDLNRLTGNGNLQEKVKFAQEMFYLLQVVLPEEVIRKDEASLERFAQWSVNLVDFMDADDVMTPFIFKKTDSTGPVSAFDNATMINELLAGNLTATMLGDDYTLIWGFEKPEVAITETLAFHDRKVLHRPGGGPNGSLEQNTRPQGSLFVKLYRQGNRQRSYAASSLVEQNGTLNLAKPTSNGDYIWRLAIGEPTKTTAGKFDWYDNDDSGKNALFQLLTPDDDEIKYPQFEQWSDGTSEGQYQADKGLGTPERFIWFGSNSPTTDNEIRRRSFCNSEGNVALVPDSFLVIAPRVTTFFNPANPPAVDLSTLPANTEMMIATHPDVTGIEVNVSEPLPTPALIDAYPTTFGGEPFDNGLNGTIPRQRGTVACYKTICLQRLADPTRPQHPICNPYITVDWSMIDLQVLNNVPRFNNNSNADGLMPNDPPALIDSGMRISSRQWESTVTPANIWDKILAPNVLTDNKAGLKPNAYANTNGFVTTIPEHALDKSDSPNKPFLHFPWHDAPFMNTGELMLVPSSAPGRFGVEFHDNGLGEEFFGDEPRFSYNSLSPYLNWMTHLAGTPASSEMAQLFDFVHVPSRFTVASDEREPGKINLNTVTKEGWNALENGRNDLDYDLFHANRRGKWNALSGTSASASLFGLDIEAQPFLIERVESNPYTILENVMRLSDVTTTRSNVFAVWITVGYFEVDQVDDFAAFQTLRTEKYPTTLSHINSDAMFKAVYPDGCLLGAEKGLDDGTVKRYRAFYLIDRSIPVDYRRGEVSNAKDVIIKKTPLD